MRELLEYIAEPIREAGAIALADDLEDGRVSILEACDLLNALAEEIKHRATTCAMLNPPIREYKLKCMH
jgi:hypothetical protein